LPRGCIFLVGSSIREYEAERTGVARNHLTAKYIVSMEIIIYSRPEGLDLSALQRLQNSGDFVAHAVAMGHLRMHFLPPMYDGGMVASTQFCADL
jgi:hypothetical protein